MNELKDGEEEKLEEDVETDRDGETDSKSNCDNEPDDDDQEEMEGLADNIEAEEGEFREACN